VIAGSVQPSGRNQARAVPVVAAPRAVSPSSPAASRATNQNGAKRAPVTAVTPSSTTTARKAPSRCATRRGGHRNAAVFSTASSGPPSVAVRVATSSRTVRTTISMPTVRLLEDTDHSDQITATQAPAAATAIGTRRERR
jgi:hypothetical protein